MKTVELENCRIGPLVLSLEGRISSTEQQFKNALQLTNGAEEGSMQSDAKEQKREAYEEEVILIKTLKNILN